MEKLKKYEIWMVQEGFENDEKTELICVGCGKPFDEDDTFWADVGYGDFYCTKKCSENFNCNLAETQRMKFAIQACKSMGFIKRGN